MLELVPLPILGFPCFFKPANYPHPTPTHTSECVTSTPRGPLAARTGNSEPKLNFFWMEVLLAKCTQTQCLAATTKTHPNQRVRALLPQFLDHRFPSCCTSQAVVGGGRCWASTWRSMRKTAPPNASQAVNSKGSYRDSAPKPVCLGSRGEPGTQRRRWG